MSENERIDFKVTGDYTKSVFRRYRYILSRGFGLRITLLTLVILVLFPLDFGPTFKYPLILILILVWIVMLVGSISLKSLLTLLDCIFSGAEMQEYNIIPAREAIIFRTNTRYCAHLELSGDNFFIRDKVFWLKNKDLLLSGGAGKKLGNCEVGFTLRIDQITAMWVARDLIVLRFCWGDSYRKAWDVILDRSRFIIGNSDEFVKCVSSRIKGRSIVYSKEELQKSNGKATLGNKSTNCRYKLLNFWIPQLKVRVIHFHLPPYIRHKKKTKEIKK